MIVKLLVSPMNVEEAKEAIAGGTDIVDVKNPKEGSLGANFPWVIKDIRNMLPNNIELSAPIGDLEFKPGLASLAAYGLATLGIDYIKVGLFGIRNEREALEVGHGVCMGVEGFNTKVVLAGYADFRDIGSVSPLKLPRVAYKVGAKAVMIDTAVKDGNGLLDYLGLNELENFIKEAHSRGLEVALAGSLGRKEIKEIQGIGADIVGIRGAVCKDGNRIEGGISSEKVRKMMAFLKRRN